MDKKSTPDELAKGFVESNREVVRGSRIAEVDVLQHVSECLRFKKKVSEQGHDADKIIVRVSKRERPESDPYRILVEKIAQFLISTGADQIDLVPQK